MWWFSRKPRKRELEPVDVFASFWCDGAFGNLTLICDRTQMGSSIMVSAFQVEAQRQFGTDKTPVLISWIELDGRE